MLRTALASICLSIFISLLGQIGLTGLSMEIGRIFLMVILTLSSLVVGAQLIFGRQRSDVL